MKSLLKQLLVEEKGQDMNEHGLLLGILALILSIRYLPLVI